jgi:hypothetical protein
MFWRVTTDVTELFLQALARLEEHNELEPLLELFGEGSEISNLASPRIFEGPEGARRFWTEYRAFFQSVRSEFVNVVRGSGRSALEWATHGTTASGHRVRYEGVSILEYEGDKIRRFFAYFDPRALAPVMPGRSSEPPAAEPLEARH